MVDDLETLAARLSGQPVVAIELRNGHSTYDKTVGRWRDRMNLAAVLAVPGWSDSRYTRRHLVTHFADEPGVAQHARKLAAACRVPRVEEDWIAQQPPPPEIDWTVTWTCRRWLPDGRHSTPSGTETARGASGQAASEAAAQAVGERLSRDGSGIAIVQTSLSLSSRIHCLTHRAGLSAPQDVLTLRRAARGGSRPSTMMRSMPGESPLAVMVAFSEAFSLSLESLEPLGALRRGERDAAAIDEALMTCIQDTEHRWGLAWLLEGVAYRREPMRKAMLAYKVRGVGAIAMILALREAFSVSLPEGKELISMCCSSYTTDAAFEERFAEIIAGHAAR